MPPTEPPPESAPAVGSLSSLLQSGAGGAPAPATPESEAEPEVEPGIEGEGAVEGEDEEEVEGEPQTAPKAKDEGEQTNLILQWMQENLGEDLTGQYATDADALKAFVHLRHLLGERNQDAALGAAFKGREREALEWLKTQEEVAKPQPAEKQKGPTIDEVRLWQAQVYDSKTGRMRDDAPRPTIDKLQSYQDALVRTLHNLTFQPDEIVDALVGPKFRQFQEQQETQTQQRQYVEADAQAVQAVLLENASWIFADPDKPDARNLTPTGRRLAQEAEALRPRTSSWTDAYDWALHRLRAEQKGLAKPVPSKVASVKRSPSSASRVTARQMTEDDIMKKNLSLSDLLGLHGHEEEAE